MLIEMRVYYTVPWYSGASQGIPQPPSSQIQPCAVVLCWCGEKVSVDRYYPLSRRPVIKTSSLREMVCKILVCAM